MTEADPEAERLKALAERWPRLTDEQANRARALIFLAVVLVIFAYARNVSFGRSTPTIQAPCPNGAYRDARGDVTCTPTDRPLRPEEALLLGAKVDLNAADADALALAKGIGPALAEQIVEDRDRRGPFRSLDDLGRVKGIGPSRIKALAEIGYVR